MINLMISVELISCPQLLTITTLGCGWKDGLRLLGGQLCCVGSKAIWKMENREAEREKETEKVF